MAYIRELHPREYFIEYVSLRIIDVSVQTILHNQMVTSEIIPRAFCPNSKSVRQIMP